MQLSLGGKICDAVWSLQAPTLYQHRYSLCACGQVLWEVKVWEQAASLELQIGGKILGTLDLVKHSKHACSSKLGGKSVGANNNSATIKGKNCQHN